MALKQPYNDRFGNSYEEAYYKVATLQLFYRGGSAKLIVAVYKDKDARDASKDPLEFKEYSILKEAFATAYGNTSTADVRARTYTHLKTLPEFENAEDC